MKKLKAAGLLIMTLLSVQYVSAQETIIPDLAKIVDGKGWTVINRKAEIVEENGQPCIHFTTPNQQGGIAWLDDLEFTNGTIEVDIKGKDAAGQSFVGLAFRGVDEETYDAVYFRPFNFRSPERNTHSVQYISHPEYTWSALREKSPGKYENSITPAPDPNEFIHAKIVVQKPKVSVYVNNNQEPSLVVNELSDRTGGKIGLWMDFVSEGTFANLKITPVKN